MRIILVGMLMAASAAARANPRPIVRDHRSYDRPVVRDHRSFGGYATGGHGAVVTGGGHGAVVTGGGHGAVVTGGGHGAVVTGGNHGDVVTPGGHGTTVSGGHGSVSIGIGVGVGAHGGSYTIDQRPLYQHHGQFTFPNGQTIVYQPPVHTERHFDVNIRPTPLVENYPPQYGYIWVDGSWAWNGYEWMWTPGYYRPDPAYSTYYNDGTYR